MATDPDATPNPVATLAAARATVTRALRLRRTADAMMAAERLHALVASKRLRESEVYHAFRFAAEEAGLRERHSGFVAQWLAQHAKDGRRGNVDPTQADPHGFGLPPDPYKRPTIEVRGDNLPEQIDQARDALINAQLGVYQRGSAIVRVAPVLDRGRDGSEANVIRLVEVDRHALRELFSRAAQWEAVRNTPKGEHSALCNCPIGVAEGYLARRGLEWHLPPLTGLIAAPTLRPDGSLLDLPGYDFCTGLFLDLRGQDFPEIPERPTWEDARNASADLLDLLDEFPFAGAEGGGGDNASLAVAVSAMLTAVVRPALPAAPAHAVTATTFGTGKSYLCDLVATIATGGPVAPIACGANDEELEKRLAADLIAGRQFIVVDNVDREINGPLLNQVLTQEKVQPRRLGKSENVEVLCTSFIMLNGNNLPLPADMVRRVVLCTLDAGEERPELRTFDSSPIATVKADRWRYVAAALTILRAYDAAGRPNPPRPLGGYEEWSNLVRGALLWLGLADPVRTQDSVREADPQRQRFAAAAAQWDLVIGNRRVTIRDAITAAIQAGAGEFREALLAVAGERGAIDGRRLGAWLGRNKGRVVGQYRFDQGALRDGNRLWVLNGATERLPAPAVANDFAAAL